MSRSDGEQPLGHDKSEGVKDDENVNVCVAVDQHASLQALYNDDNYHAKTFCPNSSK